MIKTKTLFILGAGASVPYGYPTSVELRNTIISGWHNPEISRFWEQYDEGPNTSKKTMIEFLEEFKQSGVYSIDSFLEKRPEFMNIGKIIIAWYIIRCEDDNRLRNSENNWYMYLFSRIKDSFEKLDQNKISFITFNYDRSLEQFLFEAIRSLFNKKPDECAAKIANIPIVHLYGQLDLLPWQDENGKVYSPRADIDDRLWLAPKNIKLISDERNIEKSEEFKKAYDLIRNADRIYFLGFGFDEDNLKRLKISRMQNKKIISTALGLEQSKLQWLQKNFTKMTGKKIALHKDKDAFSLLKNELMIE
jgi:hypothetical protein